MSHHLPLLALRIESDRPAANTDTTAAKRGPDEGDCTSEQITSYKDFVKEIARMIRCPWVGKVFVFGDCYHENDPQRKDYETLKEYWVAKSEYKARFAAETKFIQDALVTVIGDDPTRVFMPQETSNDAVVAMRRADPSIAKAIASAFFTSRRRRTLPEPNPYIPAEEQTDPELEGTGEYFINNYKELLVRFAKDAFNSTEAVFYENGQRLREVTVLLGLQYTDSKAYDPIAEYLHMDNQIGLDIRGCGTRYGKPVSEQDINALLMSFCADEVYAGYEAPPPSFADWVRGRQEESISADLDLSDCGTLYTDGVPIMKPEVLLNVVQTIKKYHEWQFFNYTEHQMINKLGNILSDVTTAVIRTIPDANFARLGIQFHEVSQLQWTTANMLTFHKSPGREIVFANRTVPPEGDKEYPRMRALSIVITDAEFTIGTSKAFKATIDVKGGVQDPRDPARRIKLKLAVVVLPSGPGSTMMGEDMMDET
jgi:hypothetical protein